MPREKPKSYCEATARDSELREHHDNEHGFPTRDNNRMFEYLMLEIMQAGLSWKLIIRKRQAFQRAFANFDVESVASFTDSDVQTLLQDTSIIRSEKKIRAAVFNAQAILALTKEHGSFANWLDTLHPCPKEDWVRAFRKVFRFVGPEVISEFLIGVGYLPHAHEDSCPIYANIALLNPPWIQNKN